MLSEVEIRRLLEARARRIPGSSQVAPSRRDVFRREPHDKDAEFRGSDQPNRRRPHPALWNRPASEKRAIRYQAALQQKRRVHERVAGRAGICDAIDSAEVADEVGAQALAAANAEHSDRLACEILQAAHPQNGADYSELHATDAGFLASLRRPSIRRRIRLLQ